jgi:hypothetical protein
VFVGVVVRNCRSLKEGVSSVKSAPWEGVGARGQQEPGTSRRTNKRGPAAVVVLGGRSGEGEWVRVEWSAVGWVPAAEECSGISKS